ncbi:MAG: helix-turn-helix domain-containing protein [Syntrophales bacterium]|nr:helix-turn-helix domain-containing protein [Syntrophales bacterium]
MLNIFSSKLKLLIKYHLKISQKAFAKQINVEESYLSMVLNEKSGPSADMIAGLYFHYAEYLDWLLSDENPTTVKIKVNNSTDPSPPHPCAGLEEYCSQFKNVLLSDNKVIRDAFLSNLKAFNYSINKEKEQDEKIKRQDENIDDLRAELNGALTEMRQLRAALSVGQPTGTDVAASSNTGKRET